MAVLVSINRDAGRLRRYETGGESIRLTHELTAPLRYERPVLFDAALIEKMRGPEPDNDWRVDPPPRPTNTPAGAGTVTVERRAA